MAVLNIDAAARVLMERVTGGRLDWERMTEGHRDMYRADVEAVLEAANRPVAPKNEVHVGRRFQGPDRLSYDCDCPKQPCGLTVMSDWRPGCPFHQPTKTIRQSDSLNACPGHEVLPSVE